MHSMDLYRVHGGRWLAVGSSSVSKIGASTKVGNEQSSHRPKSGVEGTPKAAGFLESSMVRGRRAVGTVARAVELLGPTNGYLSSTPSRL